MIRCAHTVVLATLVVALASPSFGLSLEDEVRIGREVMADVRHFGLTADPSLDEVGKRLSEVVERQELPWRFWVIEGMESYNAFAAPGGPVFITRKYYEKLSVDEVAFVIGHEMGHINLHHYERKLERHRKADLGHLLLNVLTKGNATWRTASDIGATAYLTHYSRALEKEADLTGYEYAQEAGYDARLAVTALAKLGEQPDLHPWIVNLYSTHPLITSREDRLAALGGEEPEDMELPEPNPAHTRDLARGLQPLDPPAPIAVRILAPEGGRWENRWRKNFTKHLHLRLIPLGFNIAGDDIMYKPDIGDPLAAARSRDARYLLLVTVHEMASETTGETQLRGTPVRAAIDVAAALISCEEGAQLWSTRFCETRESFDVLPVDREILHTDTCLGGLAEKVAADIAVGCATAAGAIPANSKEPESAMYDAATDASEVD